MKFFALRLGVFDIVCDLVDLAGLVGDCKEGLAVWSLLSFFFAHFPFWLEMSLLVGILRTQKSQATQKNPPLCV